jgi:DNA-binding GntR family transcriptional regulator
MPKPAAIPGRDAAPPSSGRPVAEPPIPRHTVARLTLERLRGKILRGDYAEGAALRQDALAAELGVSRIPVREALRQLETEGLVTFSPHVGAVVSSLSLSEIMELFELRAQIESELLRRAIPQLEPWDVERAGEVLDAYEAAFRARDVGKWGELNWKFHATLLEPARRPLTMGLLQNLHNQSDRYTRLQLTLTHGEVRADEEHRAILDVVRNGEVQRACALLRSHILGAGRSLLEFLRVHRTSANGEPKRRARP